MKKIIFILLLACFSYIELKAIEVERVYDKNANGCFDFELIWYGSDWVMIYCPAGTGVCPTSVNPSTGNPTLDMNTNNAADQLFQHADQQINAGNDIGNHSITIWVSGEPTPRIYSISWYLMENDFYKQTVTRVQ